MTVAGTATPPVPPELAGAADELAAAALTLARRLDAGATLWSAAPGAEHHARHVAVEFVHPVIVGKRSFPAVAITDAEPVEAARLLIAPGDVVVAIGDGRDPRVAALVHQAVQRGATTILLAAGSPLGYHLLWELTHVVFEHPGLLDPAGPARATEPEATAFLYPFIGADERDPGALLGDLAASARRKMEESSTLRFDTLRDLRGRLTVAARAMAGRFLQGGRLFTFGNGGSATDADAVAGLFRRPPSGRPLPARSLVEDQSVLTALANDVGYELVFARQLIAHGRPTDVALAVSTSGGSANVLAGLAEARRRGLLTVGLCGYDGGTMAAGGSIDHCLVVRSDSVHRIQEAQDAVLQSLWSAVQAELAPVGP